MALDVFKGTLTAKTGSTGTVAYTGVGFQPKAIIFWLNSRTAAGFGTQNWFGLGAATSTSARWAVTHGDTTATASATTWRRYSAALCVYLNEGDSTVSCSADLSSLDADGFTLNWTAISSAFIVHYLALGGTDLTNATAGTTTYGAGTGSKSVTGIGYQPDFLLQATNNNASASGNTFSMTYGAAGLTGQGAITNRSRNGSANMEVGQWQRTDRLMVGLSATASSTTTDCTFTSFDSDGWTVNWTNDPNGLVTYYLALKGPQTAVLSDTQKTSTGTKATTGAGFTPSAAIFFGANAATNTSGDYTQMRASLGAATATAEGGVWHQSADAAATSDTDSHTSSTKCLTHATQASTIDAEADLSSFDSDGFTLDWTTADATAREFVAILFGDAAAAPSSTVRMLASAGVGT